MNDTAVCNMDYKNNGLVALPATRYILNMDDILCAGVDFSGAKNVPNNTWLAVGRLTNLGLEIISLVNCGSHALGKHLMEAGKLSAAGLDFPFSLPIAFLDYLSSKKSGGAFQSWQDVAEYLAFCSFEQFLDEVVAFEQEPKRITDQAVHRSGISPLHRGNPSMVQMTFQGIRMLASLDPAKFFVLPFQNELADGCAVIEVYPRETLYSLSLPDTGYKSADTEVRKKIIAGLHNIRNLDGHKDCPRISLNKNIERQILASNHALDAVIACYATATWKVAPQLCKDPFACDDLSVLLEGWIYAPSLLR